MIMRLLTCALACMLAAAPASAQLPVQWTDAGTEPPTLTELDRTSASELDARARMSDSEPDVRARMSARELDLRARVRTPAASETAAEPSTTFGRRASAVASTIVRTLAARNRLWVGPPEEQMDAYLRPPSGDGTATIFHEAKALYEEATSYRTEWYDVSFDPLSLKCRLKVRLSP